MNETLKAFLLAAISGVVAGVMKVVEGGSREEAINASIEALANERAEQKFPDLKIER